MKIKGYLTGLGKSFLSKGITIQLTTEDNVLADCESLQGKELTIEIKQFREKRTLNANRYYRHLVSELAKVMKTSEPYMHNLMMIKYGTPETLDDEVITVDIPFRDDERYMEFDLVHLKPTSRIFTVKDKATGESQTRQTMIMMKPSHTLDTKEMSDLISGVVEECQEQGIQTMTPNEIERLKSLWQTENQ